MIRDEDAAGNMTTIPQPQAPNSSFTLKYDAWNRVVEVKDDGSTVIQTNEFDGLNRRIQKVVGADTYDYYYNGGRKRDRSNIDTLGNYYYIRLMPRTARVTPGGKR